MARRLYLKFLTSLYHDMWHYVLTMETGIEIIQMSFLDDKISLVYVYDINGELYY